MLINLRRGKVNRLPPRDRKACDNPPYSLLNDSKQIILRTCNMMLEVEWKIQSPSLDSFLTSG